MEQISLDIFSYYFRIEEVQLIFSNIFLQTGIKILTKQVQFIKEMLV